MGIQSIGGFSGISAWQNYATPTQSAGASATTKAPSVEQQFLDEVKKPAGQRMVEAWLKAHHLTEEDLKNMPSEKRNAILKQMAEEIKEQTKRKAEQGSGLVNILA